MQLDNTTGENKNETVLGFLAWLCAVGTFKKVTLSFLPVGHTHEDIDAVFGVLMRYLNRIDRISTLEELIQAIEDCLSSSMDGVRTSWKPSARTQRMIATHDWVECFVSKMDVIYS